MLVSFVLLSFPVGLERWLLATVRWTVATAVAFQQESESNSGISNVYIVHKKYRVGFATLFFV